MTNNQSPLQSFLPWHLSWLTVVLAVLAIGTFIAVSDPGVGYVTPMGTRGGMEYSGSGGGMPPMGEGVPIDTSVSNAPAKDMMYPNPYYPYPYPNPDVPVTDTREFLKTYYNAFMRTRDVPALTRRVETTVRGYNGRIDQESSSSEYGSVSFAVPESKYDAFRAELEGLVGSRFLSVNISSQNLLPQKLSIEEQKKQADTNLASLQTQRRQIIEDHDSKVRSLQAEIDTNANVQVALRAEVTNDPARQASIASQLSRLSVELVTLKSRLVTVNSNYTNSIASIDSQIKYAQDWQKAVQTQDQTLLDNVATVTGTISIQWISLWDTARLYLPGYWIPFIFAVLALLSFANDRRRSGNSVA